MTKTTDPEDTARDFPLEAVLGLLSEGLLDQFFHHTRPMALFVLGWPGAHDGDLGHAIDIFVWSEVVSQHPWLSTVASEPLPEITNEQLAQLKERWGARITVRPMEPR